MNVSPYNGGTITITKNNGDTVTPSTYPANVDITNGTLVTFTANGDFVRWQGDITGSQNPTDSIYIFEALNITAIFDGYVEPPVDPIRDWDCGWACWDQIGKKFFYENVDYPERITTITVTNATSRFWRITIDKNHPETYWGSWEEDQNCILDWWGNYNQFGFYARGGRFFDYSGAYQLGVQYYANQDKQVICDSGYPTYIILPPEPFGDFPWCLVQTQSVLMLIDGEQRWYDFDWIVHYDWEVIWVPYLQCYVKALKSMYSESREGVKLIEETWWHVEDLGLVQIESKHWANDETGRAVKIRLIDIQE